MTKPDNGLTIADLRTIAEACAQLECSRHTLRRLVREGKLDAVRFGGKVRIIARSLDTLIDRLDPHPPKPP